MTGPEHFRRAEKYIDEAAFHLDKEEMQTAVTWATLAQVHATLATAAATAIGTSAQETRAWADAARTKPSGRG